MLTTFAVISLVIGVGAVLYAYSLYRSIMQEDPGNEKMQKIAKAIQHGARAFLHAEYKWLAVFVGGVFVLMCFSDFTWHMGVPFLMGALASAIAGYFGMHTATRAAVRTAQAATGSLGKALDVAFRSGTVMGLTVVGLGLLGVSILVMVAVRASDGDMAALQANLNNILDFENDTVAGERGKDYSGIHNIGFECEDL